MKIISNMVFAGPCSAESREQVMETARGVAEALPAPAAYVPAQASGTNVPATAPAAGAAGAGTVATAAPAAATITNAPAQTTTQGPAQAIRGFRAGVWKPRTSPGSYEGEGDQALEWVAEAGRTYGLLTAVEVATPAHVEASLKAGIDCLWIGARTSADPFAAQQLADALKGCPNTILLKNPITPDINLWCGALDRLINAGLKDIILIHRGFYTYQDSFYRNNPIWSIPMEMRRRRPGFKMLCDPSHIAGRSALVEDLIEKAAALDFDGLFVEAHCRPEEARSDAAQQITPARLGEILQRANRREPVAATAEMALFRDEIDKIDSSIIDLLARRMEISRSIGTIKKAGQMQVFSSGRYDKMLEACRTEAERAGLDPGFAEEIFRLIHEKSVEEQL